MSPVLRSSWSLALAPAMLLCAGNALAQTEVPVPSSTPVSSSSADPANPPEQADGTTTDTATAAPVPAKRPTATPTAAAPSLTPSAVPPATGAVVPGVTPGVIPTAPLPPGSNVAAPVATDTSAVVPGMAPTTGEPTMPSDPLGQLNAPGAIGTTGEASATPSSGQGWDGFFDALQVFGYDADITSRSGGNGLAGGFGAPGFAANPLLEGFRGTASVRAAYDTNASMGYGPTGDDEQFYTTYAATLAYRSNAPTLNYSGLYSGGYNWYFDNDDLSGYNQRAAAGVYYTPGGAFSAYGTLGFDFGSGANRYYAAVVDEARYNASLGARYTISPKTSLVGTASFSATAPSGSTFNDTTSYNLGLSGMWRYSERTEFGPGIRYSYRTGDTQDDRTSLGPIFTVNYEATAKTKLFARAGVDFVDYDNGGDSDTTFSAAAGINYMASELWGLKFALLRDTEADPSWNQGYLETTALRLSYYRKISRATLTCGASYEFSDSEMPTNGKSRPNRDYFAFDASLGMPLFAESCYGFLFTRYSDQDGGPTDSWDSFQFGAGLSYQF